MQIQCYQNEVLKHPREFVLDRGANQGLDAQPPTKFLLFSGSINLAETIFLNQGEDVEENSHLKRIFAG
jgi:hypothetical protein